MRLYIIGNVCSISASATAIQPTNIPTHNPNIAIIIFPQMLLTGTLGIFAKPRLYAVSSTDDILPATTPHIMTFSISIIFSILLHRSIRGTTPITSTNANTPADTPAPAKNAITDKIISLLESCKDGDIPFVVQNTAPQVTFMKDTAVFDMPALFDSIDEVREHVDNPKFMKLMQQVYNDGGYELLGYADQGFRVMTTNKKIESLADFKGQKIRTMENPYHMAYWKALGASPTPMTFSEVYIGLQQGTIDAQENPYEVIVSNKLYEQQDYVVETNHLPHLISLIVSEEFMKGLTDEQQQIIREAAETAKQYAREQSDERIASKIKTIEDSGTQIITLSDEVHEQIRKECQPIYESIEKNVSSDIVDAYLTQ